MNRAVVPQLRLLGAQRPRSVMGVLGRMLILAAVFAPAAAAENAYDIIQSGYGRFTDRQDPHGFAMKVWALDQDQYTFWRGGRDVFFRWCRDNCSDWLGDPGAYVLNHGDLHLGNIGSYAREGRLGATEFGATDFDDTARLPFQIELLQGLISMRLAARENHIELNGARRDEIARTMFDAYRKALLSVKSTTELVSDERRIGRFIDAARDQSYDATLDRFTDKHGRFKSVVTSPRAQKVKEILRPAMDQADRLSRIIARGIAHSPEVRKLFNYSDAATIRKSIKDAARRTRLESVGSQGLNKYLVLMERPLKGLDMDVVLYVKQEIPAAAERAGAVPHDPRSAGQRCSEDMDRLTNPGAYLNTWADGSGGESYWITFKEPWSEEIDVTEIKDFSALRAMAGVWGNVVGVMHRDRGAAGDPHVVNNIRQRLDPGLLAILRHRSTSYMAELDRQFHDFTTDPRTRADAAKAQALVDAARQQAQAGADARSAAHAAVP